MSIQQSESLVEMDAREKFYQRHISDISRINFFERNTDIGQIGTLWMGNRYLYAFVGAGTVVNRNVPDHALVVGSPGKTIGWVCECGERLSDDLECLVCGNHYAQNQSGVAERPALIASVKAAMGDG